MSDVVEIHVTCPAVEDARRLSDVLLERRLAACCNIGAKVDSRYLWKGSIERSDETPLTIKTRAELFDACAAAIRENHPYETPAIFGFAVPCLDSATRDWILETTRAS